ncbi:MAG: HIRAN domain-containing protein [Abditibacteriota bacterium]|nr:HIRAN domain-containing protein [Abditibacteriota bacterium]
MSDKLAKPGKTAALAETVEQKGIEEMLRPLIKEIHLFDTFVAGTSHLRDKTVLEEITVGQKLVLQREDNKYDRKAVLVLTEDKRKLGYIPEKDNTVFSRLMDAGKLLGARITDIEKQGTYTKIGIGIFLVDF